MNSIKKPKVSVVIPAYNKADFTVQAVESVLNQTYKNIECIVVDDGSTIIADFIQPHFYTKRVKFISQRHQGASVARNRGIQEANGEYIALLDCDDLYLPEKIELCVKENKDFIYTPAWLINQEGEPVGMYRPKRGNLLFNNYICNSVVIKKKCFEKVGLFDENLFICADWDMWLRMEEHFELSYLDKPLTKYRI